VSSKDLAFPMGGKRIIALFIFYSLLGAIAEHVSYFVAKLRKPAALPKALNNPILTGFPIYGLGGLLVVWLHPIIFAYGILAEAIVYGGVLTLIELVSGLIVKAGAGSTTKCTDGKDCIDSWDYSKGYGNLFGVVDIWHFVAFAIAGIVITKINPYVETALCL
jgi:hypothetical protein